jgi:hypothetical protein
MLLLALALQAGVTLITPREDHVAALPNSLQRGELAACAPTTLEAAEQCLRASLSAEELAIVQDRIPARRYRPALDCEIETAWHLDDPSSPMARVMDGLLGLHHPHLAAGMILTDMQVRAQTNSGFAFDQVREELGQNPPPPPNPNDCRAADAPSS